MVIHISSIVCQKGLSAILILLLISPLAISERVVSLYGVSQIFLLCNEKENDTVVNYRLNKVNVNHLFSFVFFNYVIPVPVSVALEEECLQKIWCAVLASCAAENRYYVTNEFSHYSNKK